jgi:hypothetical protein
MDQNTLVTIGIFIANMVVAALVGWGAASKKIGEYQNKVDGLEVTMGKDEHGGLRKTVGDIHTKVIACETRLEERGPLLQRQSPVSLTERGSKFLEDSNGKQFVDENFSELLSIVDAMDPKTAYDVQEDAKEAINKLTDDDRINPIKEYLFKDGSTLQEAFAVMSIYLRNKILTHKEWNVADIDHQEGTDES